MSNVKISIMKIQNGWLTMTVDSLDLEKIYFSEKAEELAKIIVKEAADMVSDYSQFEKDLEAFNKSAEEQFKPVPLKDEESL